MWSLLLHVDWKWMSSHVVLEGSPTGACSWTVMDGLEVQNPCGDHWDVHRNMRVHIGLGKWQWGRGEGIWKILGN